MRDLSVASYNIHKGVGGDLRRDLDRTTAVIAELGADILALQEADTRFGTPKGLLDLESIRRDLGLIAVPLAQNGAAHGWHGNLLLIKNALIQDIHPLTLPGFEPRGAMVTDVQIAGQSLRIINTHFGLLPRSRAAQARAIIDKIATLQDRPMLLLGDLNEWRGSAAMLKTLGERFQIAPPKASFPARYPMLPFDRILIGASGGLSEIFTHDTDLARRASDHLPIKAWLTL